MMFIRNVTMRLRRRICLFGVVVIFSSTRNIWVYLLWLVGRNHKLSLRLKKKEYGRNYTPKKMISYLKVGRKILIKAVALSLHTYAISSLMLHGSFCIELQIMMAQFWWGKESREEKYSIYQVGENVSQSLKEGQF